MTADGSVSAERGYLREAGNLVFHVSLLFLLLGVALGGLFGFRGTSVVVVGQGFANTITQYDDFTSGGRFSDTPAQAVRGHGTRTSGCASSWVDVQRGAARLFALDAEVTPRPGAAPFRQTIEVNRPLDVDGTTVHLIGHGYAPLVTVTDGQGNVAFSGPVVFLPQDGNFTSAGVIKAPDGRPERLAFEGIFAPTAVVDDRGPRSLFPDALDPALYVNAWAGPPKVETGRPENVYSLNPAGLTQLKDAEGPAAADPAPARHQLRAAGRPGHHPDGRRDPLGQAADQRHPGRGHLARRDRVRGARAVLLALRPSTPDLGSDPAYRAKAVRWSRSAGLDRADARAGLGEDVAALAAETGPATSRPEGADSR